MTKQLYYFDHYATEFTATVLNCEAKDGAYAVELDQTLFYPEGGGQPADHGWINGIAVTDTREKNGVIVHTMAQPLEIGTAVSGKIDWNRRFDLMQSHSGEHILSGVICGKYHCDNVGFHLNMDKITLDFNAKIADADLPAIELAANEAIWKNLPVEITHPSQEELAVLPYRSKKALSGDIRIVTIAGYDCCACCGIHVAHTGEIGQIKILSTQNYKGGTRMEVCCGMRALRSHAEKNESVLALSHALSVPVSQVAIAAQNKFQELDELKHLRAAEKWETFQKQAAQIPDGITNLLFFADGLDSKDVAHLGDLLSSKISGTVALFSKLDGDNYSFLLLNPAEDVRPLLKELQNDFGCKGGGKAGAVQGRVTAAEAAILSFFQNRGFSM